MNEAQKNQRRPSFFHHLHPPTIPAQQARFRYTLGMGGLSVFMLLVLLVTGALEMYFYVPTPEQASPSIQMITFLVPFGALIRNMHFWSAQLLVATASLHLLRVIFTGSYAPPRRFNYLLGMSLYVLVLLLDFSGYILRWDEGIRWALVAGTNLIKSIPVIGSSLYLFIMGGQRPGSATLLRFYSWHLFGLTLTLVLLIVWHIFRVRRDGGIAVPPPELRSDQVRISRFELARREALAALLSLCLLLLISNFMPAPLAPGMTKVTSQVSDARAPWFFLWVQELLRFGNAFWMGVAVPLGILSLLVLLPYVTPNPAPAELGRWFPRSSRPAQVIAAVLVLILLGITMKALFLP
jgi:quinol-cytochrome oxidoreductase complex cytochrome b subunit